MYLFYKKHYRFYKVSLPIQLEVGACDPVLGLEDVFLVKKSVNNDNVCPVKMGYK